MDPFTSWLTVIAIVALSATAVTAGTASINMTLDELSYRRAVRRRLRMYMARPR